MKNFCRRLAGICFLLFATQTRATIHYVDANSGNATPPFTDWTTAATNIQDAIEASVAGDMVLVTNGIYATGGKSKDGVLTNRVSVDKAITVQSLNGPLVTIIQGAGVTNGNSSVRCAWLTNGASLVGFMLQFGTTRSAGPATSLSGGGVWCSSSNATVANCVIKSNAGFLYAGGAYQGTLNSCLICSNTLTLVPGGSGVFNAVLNNCSVIGNLDFGVYQSFPGVVLATNCIIYFNSAGNYSGGTYSHCCTTPASTGAG